MKSLYHRKIKHIEKTQTREGEDKQAIKDEHMGKNKRAEFLPIKKTSTRGRRQAYGQEDEQMGKKTNKHMGKKTDEK